ncbi:MAG: HEAT repeat domain-containing protein [Planctomycetota bacterium]
MIRLGGYDRGDWQFQSAGGVAISTRFWRILWICIVSVSLLCSAKSDTLMAPPYDRQTAEQIELLKSATNPQTRAAAAEALGFLRNYDASDALARALGDPAAIVRREAAVSLGFCGKRQHIKPLIAVLDDPDWVTRQSAWVALTNLTGMEWPFDSLAEPVRRSQQVARWYKWWATVPADRPPAEVLQLLKGFKYRAYGKSVTASSTYKGPPGVLIDGLLGSEFWQTKNVPFPQWCTIDIGRAERISQVAIHQYGPRFVLTDYELATSLDNKTFEVIERKKGTTSVKLVINFPLRLARYVRVTSYGSANPTYPTTFFEIRVGTGTDTETPSADSVTWRCERGLRALGALGGSGATEAILRCLGPRPPTGKVYRPMVRAGIRSLGQLRDEAGFSFLLELLDNTYWARYAADALGDFGDPCTVPALLAAYRKYGKQLDGSDPRHLPRDDKMGFPSEDRMLETPYYIAFALSRLLGDSSSDWAAVREIAPLIMSNLPSDHDTFLLYEPEVAHLLTRYLLEVSGLRQETCEHAFELLGQPRRIPKSRQALQWPRFGAGRMATWLPAVCTEKADLPRLIVLLGHKDGWVRLNAAKTLAWLGDKRAIEPISKTLAEAKAEAEYGYTGTFKDEEYADPAPRWREGLIRALGLLGAHTHTDLITGILEDEGSVLEVRHAAAEALADLGNKRAQIALKRAATENPFHSIRLVARDALRILRSPPGETGTGSYNNPVVALSSESSVPAFDAVVFIKGDNSIPNTIGTVEQADRWRQTYVVTDSGPAYRPGRNLYVLRPPEPNGIVTPLTRFAEGYVAEPELSWDGRYVIFTHRDQNDPWWHIYRINVDGLELEQLTDGPYHDVGPAYLPDGRIVFTSSRAGIPAGTMNRRSFSTDALCSAAWKFSFRATRPN